MYKQKVFIKSLIRLFFNTFNLLNSSLTAFNKLTFNTNIYFLSNMTSCQSKMKKDRNNSDLFLKYINTIYHSTTLNRSPVCLITSL